MRRSRPTLSVVVVYALLGIFWPTTWLVIKVTLKGTSPLLGSGLRFLVAGGCFAVYRLASARSLRVAKESVGLVLIVAVGYFAIPYALLYLGETQITSGLAALLSSTTPLFIVLLAQAMLADEPWTWQKLFGVGLGLCGLALIFHGGLTIKATSLWVLAMVGVGVSPIAHAFAQVVVRRDALAFPVALLNAWAMLIAAFMLIAVGLMVEPRKLRLDAATLGSIAYLALPGSVLPYAGVIWLLKRSSAFSVGLVSLVLPVIALFEGWAVYSERLDWSMVLGALVVFTGLLVSTALQPRNLSGSGRQLSPVNSDRDVP